MFDNIQYEIETIEGCIADPLGSLRLFVATHREALINAAALLGDRRRAGIALAVIEGLGECGRSPRRVLRDTGDLVALLALDHVQDEARGDAACFAAIEPWDPLVEEICLLTDGLLDALDRCGPLSPPSKDIREGGGQ